jgi:IclR family transcriptional regulator, acetate operon repressor
VTVGRDPVARAIDVLTWIADHPAQSISVRQVARDIGTSPATVYRILQSFQEHALIGRDAGGEYTAGLELHRICAAIARGLSPARIARPHLEALARESGEATLFGIYDAQRGEMMFIDKIEASHPLRYEVELNRWIPIHAGATGLAILASLSFAERRRIYATGLSPLTSETLVTAEDLEAAVAVIRRRGYAQSSGQRTTGAVGLAAPVFDSDGLVCGDICITVPQQRFEADEASSRLPAAVMAQASAATRELQAAGYRRAGAGQIEDELAEALGV